MKKMIMLLAVFGGLALASAAHANSLTLVNDAIETTGSFDWNYHVNYANSQLNAGDFVTIQNVTGVTSANTFAFGTGTWTGTFTATSVTWTYSGPTQNLGSGSGTISGFSYHDIFGAATTSGYNTQDHVATGKGAGRLSTVTGFVDVAAAPDGGSAVALLGIGLATIEGLRRKIGARKL